MESKRSVYTALMQLIVQNYVVYILGVTWRFCFVFRSVAKESHSVLACLEAFPGGNIRLPTERDIRRLPCCFGDLSIPACDVFENF